MNWQTKGCWLPKDIPTIMVKGRTFHFEMAKSTFEERSKPYTKTKAGRQAAIDNVEHFVHLASSGREMIGWLAGYVLIKDVAEGEIVVSPTSAWTEYQAEKIRD